MLSDDEVDVSDFEESDIASLYFTCISLLFIGIFNTYFQLMCLVFILFDSWFSFVKADIEGTEQGVENCHAGR